MFQLCEHIDSLKLVRCITPDLTHLFEQNGGGKYQNCSDYVVL